MKYLEYTALEEINTGLSCIDTLDTRVFARLDAYSCKNTTDDKKLLKHIDGKYDEDLLGTSATGVFATTPTATGLSPSSPFGPLAQITSRKTLFYLLATLNAAFPDYDFSDIKPDVFTKIPSASIVRANVDSTLFGMVGLGQASTRSINRQLWDAIDEINQLEECDIYSFNPSPEVEPDSEEGNLWSFYYFFFNRKLKRIVFFTARAVSYMAPVQPEELTNDIYGDDIGDEPMFDSEMGLSYEQYTMESMEI